MPDSHTVQVIAGCLSLYLAGVIASAAGVGGGGLNLPILLVIFGWKYTECVSLSLATVMGNYIAQTALNFNRRHPASSSRPLIYWDAVLVLLPAQLGGSNVGVLLATVLPTTVLLILAMTVVVYAGYRTLSKGMKYYRLETLQKRNLLTGETYLSVPTKGDENGVHPKRNSSEQEHGLERDDEFSANADSLTESLIPFSSTPSSSSSLSPTESHSRLKIPMITISALLGVWIVYAVIFVVSKSYVAPCSAGFFSILACSYVPLTLTILWGIFHISQKQKADPSSILVGDLHFRHLSFLPPTLSFFIGILCSLLGIGGGELMGPLLLSLKVIPQVSSATTSIMSLLNSSLTVLHYAIVGNMELQWMAICFSIGLLSGFSGRAFALYITAKYERPSLLVFCLLFVLFLSLCLLIYNVASEKSPDFDFHSLC